MDARFVDLKLISEDAIYSDEDGVEHQVEWVTQRDVELARRISNVARDHGVRADPSSITTIELALDTAHAGAVAPVWSALLTGGADAQGRGTISEDIRDATWRVPILWFQRDRGAPDPAAAVPPRRPGALRRGGPAHCRRAGCRWGGRAGQRPLVRRDRRSGRQQGLRGQVPRTLRRVGASPDSGPPTLGPSDRSPLPLGRGTVGRRDGPSARSEPACALADGSLAGS